tara:strand:- start:3396 stop:4772 length:1377 start_codon:yes stop_codon:yes gene_type:complete
MENLSTLDKASKINHDNFIYGTFAEIGAGQEVARQFFEAGRSSKTIAKTISAYDMTFSDAIYGEEKSKRYVCQARVENMLNYEYGLVESRLSAERGDRSKFFAYANTLTTGSRKRNLDSHGWVGLKFQKEIGGPINQVVAHIRMKNRTLSLQREAVGAMGVNLLYACFYLLDDPDRFIDSLLDNIGHERLEIDFIEFSGENTSHIDNRLMSLKIVEKNLTRASIFSPDGTVLHIADVLFQKDVLLLRGNFCPVTKVHEDMIAASLDALEKKNIHPIVILEMTLKTLTSGSKEEEKLFLDRMEALRALGHPVLVSNFFLFHNLKQHLEKFVQKTISIVIGGNLLPKLFEDKHYEHLDGGLLEGMGKLLNGNTNLFIYPYSDDKGKQSNFASFKESTRASNITEYIEQKFLIEDLKCHNDLCRNIMSEEVLQMIRKQESTWQDLVPAEVAKVIEAKKLFQ